jgi:hypothetical protein
MLNSGFIEEKTNTFRWINKIISKTLVNAKSCIKSRLF